MEQDMTYEETVQATEEAIRNTSETTFYSPDNFSYKINDDFLFTLHSACKSSKELGLVIWLVKKMNKANIVHNIVVKDLILRAELARATYYKAMTRLEEADLIIKLNKKTIMVNPNIVINHRKSLNKDRPQLLSLWSEYKLQQRKDN